MFEDGYWKKQLTAAVICIAFVILLIAGSTGCGVEAQSTDNKDSLERIEELEARIAVLEREVRGLNQSISLMKYDALYGQ